MPGPGPTHSQPRGGRIAKRAAIIDGARAVFGRDGYTRASVDAIAAQAGVSTRTVYNHFGDKEHLFAEVVTGGATDVHSALSAHTAARLTPVTDAAQIEGALVALARDWVATMDLFPAHFAVARQVAAESAHLDPRLVEAWYESGPLAARTDLARHFDRLARSGLLRSDDPDRTARHFHLLAFAEITERSGNGAVPLPEAETELIIASGVRAFLTGYQKEQGRQIPQPPGQ
ncbi:transcriptional regulator, TetR family [Catenulispora acidiphila DSM 44928]|uniref:Transcriptional regulator, TetR family n=1 Tax=Catenulispora acidiphila (strain DSM 44928 / JCM 14897 / NBRC 102108 / NRRL B-24433 / ID139908) TaxID=479433 RepID=C7PY95_CATAD|nr:TetR/AcrR family transcriptional regulator [Catenulispora acidiphila]ACU75385.1 transcriptional regulator, TetR family [Catenulispora acidiphila DSM 44928]